MRKDPDDLTYAISKNLKQQKSPIMRITFKRGGLWKPQYAKIHSRISRNALKQQIRKQNQNNDEVHPLYCRYKSEKDIINVEVKKNKGLSFMNSLLSVFRVNFFKKNQQKVGIQKKNATKSNPNSKTTLKKIRKTQRNKQRRMKRNQIRRTKNREKKHIQINTITNQ